MKFTFQDILVSAFVTILAVDLFLIDEPLGRGDIIIYGVCSIGILAMEIHEYRKLNP